MLQPRQDHLFACLLNFSGKEDFVQDRVDLFGMKNVSLHLRILVTHEAPCLDRLRLPSSLATHA